MSEASSALPLPPAMPQFRQNAWRRLCGGFLRCCGWRIAGQFPDEPRIVLIAAPHSSWWDGVWGLLFKVALGVDLTFMGKRELFHGPLGWALRQLGGIPIERSTSHGLVGQTIERFRGHPKLWFGMAPEGTRKRVGRWKTGFWHIARAVDAPILPMYFDYPSKTIGIGPLFRPGADMQADLDALHAFYRPFRGKHHNA
jgi:1-acyl-sn-glycerol-3-phosphate acyltransferase